MAQHGMVRVLGLAALVGMSALIPAEGSAQHETAAEANREARHEFEAGRDAFAQGRYEEAITHFQRSYDLSRAPDLLYNIGHTAERLRLDERALTAFEQYLEARPDTEARESIEARMALLRESIARREAEATAEAGESGETGETAEAATPLVAAGPSDQQSHQQSDQQSVVGWSVAGAGVAVAIGGAVLLGVGSARAGEVQNAPPGTPWQDVRDAYADADSLSIAGAVLLGVGGAAAVVGVVIALAGEGSDSTEVTLGPGGLQVRGRF